MVAPAKRLLILGAGPMGIEAALAGARRGFDVTVLERERVGASLFHWGRARFFSPFAMNVSPEARALLGADAPSQDALLSGPEMVERVLEPLARSRGLAGRVRVGCEVIAIGRARQLRREHHGHPLRAERPFRVLVDGPDGEQVFEAEVVLDATGATRPTWIGAGSQPVVGERAIGGELIRDLGALDRELSRFAGQCVLVVGHGHSAAHAIGWLAELARQAPGTRVIWAVRTLSKRPCVEVASDPLPERARVVLEANGLAASPPPWLEVVRKVQLEAVSRQGKGYRAVLSNERSVDADVIVGLTGFRPELEMLEELQVEISPVSGGARGIHRALSSISDCLSAPKLGRDDLVSGEPGFFLIGQKSYGRLPTFLLKSGLAQLESIFELGERS